MQGTSIELFSWLISAFGGFIGAALLLPTKLGEAIIKYRVDKTLETFKNEQAHKLEDLRAQLDHYRDRGKRSNEMEFRAIELVWKAFVKAWLSTNTCIGQMIQIPDFARMTEDEIKSFARGSRLSDNEKDSLIAAVDKQKEYMSILSWQSVQEAGRDIYDSRLVLREQRIFLPAKLTQDFSEVIELMSGAQVQRRLSLQHPEIREYRFGDAQTVWMNENVKTFDTLASLANKRLFREEATT